MNSKKGRGKRFLAGFLALLMAVTLLPVNAAGVAYAEELDAIETEAPDSVVAVDEDTEAADGVVEADEETDEPQVNDGESSEEVEPEDGLTAGEEDLALEEVVPELEEAVAVASEEEVFAPAEVSATVDTTGYSGPTTTTWEFTKANFTKWSIATDKSTEIKGTDSLNGIKVNSNSKSGKVKAKGQETTPSLSVDAEGIIDIPISASTDAVVIEITLASNNNARWIYIGAGEKKETVYHNNSTASGAAYVEGKPYFSNNYYTNDTLYKKTDEMFSTVQNDEETSSTVLSITGNVGETKITKIVLHEYEKIKPVNLNDPTAAVELSIGEGKAQTAAYTGQPFDLDVLNLSVTTGEGENKVEANPLAYTTSFLRETDTEDVYADTKDLTSVGKIKVKVTSGEAPNVTEKESNAFEITPANLVTTDKKEPVNKSDIDSTNGYPGTVDLSALVTPLSEDDEFEYTLSEETGYDAGAVVETTDNDKKPAITGSTLTYTVKANADVSSADTVLLVKVTSSNYNDAYIKVTVSVMDKPAVTVSGNSVEKEYDGQAYGFKANAVIAVTGVTGDDEAIAAAIANIKANLNYTFKKVGATDDEPFEPTDAGVYNVDATLSSGSDYTMSDYKTTESGDSVQLTIKPRTITIIPNGGTWDKTFDAVPTAKDSENVTSDDYTFKDGKGLVTGDTMTQPSIKYYKHGETAELTTAGWSALEEGDTVDVVAADANAGSNYYIKYEVGTIEVKVTTPTEIAAITGKGSTLVMTDIPNDKIDSNDGNKVAKDTLVNGFLLTGGGSSTNPKNASANGKNYTLSLKSSGGGDQYSKSIGFTIDKPATLYIVAHTDGGNDTRKMALSRLDTNYQLVECVGTKYSKDTTKDLTYAAGGIDINTSANYLSIELTEDGTYYIYAPGSGLRFYEVTVTYKEEDDPNPDYTITLDKSKIATDGAAVTEGSKKAAKATTTVALADVVTVTPNEGFEFKGWEVTAADGTSVTVSADNTFTMPASNVTVTPIVMATGAVVAPTATPGSTTQTIEVAKGSKVKLTVPGNDFDHIYYTTGATVADAADPKVASADRKDYAVASPDGIEINEAMTIKAVAAKGAAESETFSDVVTYSYTVSEVTPGTVHVLDSVKLTGNAYVGSTLTAKLNFTPSSNSIPDGTSATYEWFHVVDGAADAKIEGATGNTYTIKETDKDKAIKVKVTYVNENSETSVKEDTSAVVTASKLKGNGIEIEFDDGSTYIYTGTKITPSITVYNNGTPLVEGTDYTVRYTNNVNVSHKVEADGTTLNAIQTNPKKLPTVTVTGKGNLSRPVSETFKIVPKALDNDDYADAANTVPDVEAKGVVVVENKKVTPVLVYGGVKLALRRNFDYKTPDDKNKTTWQDGDTLTLVGVENSNFTGENNLKVSVVAKTAQADAKMSVQFTGGNNAVKNLYYNGSEHRIGFDVTTKGGLSSTSDDSNTKLIEGEDYTISYPADLINVGAKKVIITGISKRCMGSVTKSYSVKPADKTGGATFEVTGVNPNGYDYVSTGVTFDLTGENAVTVKYVPNTSDNTRAVSADGESLVPGKDFKITYTNNKKASTDTNTAKYTVTGLGNYKGVVLKNQSFKINPIKLIGSNSDVKVTVADVLYNKSAKYKSVPYVTVNGATLKASEYDVWYIIGTGDNASETKNQTRKITDDDLTSGSLDVTVKIVPKANSKNVVGPAEGGSETAFTEDFKIIKSTDTLTFSKDKDLSKARITFYGGDDPRKDKNKVGFTGEAVYPTKMEIKFNGERESVTLDLVDGQLKETDNAQYGFTLTYADNVAKGKASVVVTADGTKYVGGKTATFNIVAKELDKLNKDNGEGFIASFMNGLLNK